MYFPIELFRNQQDQDHKYSPNINKLKPCKVKKGKLKF